MNLMDKKETQLIITQEYYWIPLENLSPKNIIAHAHKTNAFNSRTLYTKNIIAHAYSPQGIRHFSSTQSIYNPIHPQNNPHTFNSRTQDCICTLPLNMTSAAHLPSTIALPCSDPKPHFPLDRHSTNLVIYKLNYFDSL